MRESGTKRAGRRRQSSDGTGGKGVTAGQLGVSGCGMTGHWDRWGMSVPI